MDTVGAFMDGLVWSVTAAMRQTSNSEDTPRALRAVCGQTHVMQTCLTVRWAWLSLPASLLGLQLAFLVAIVVISGSAKHWRGGWKDSSLALLFHGLEGSAKPPHEKVEREELRDKGGMFKRLRPQQYAIAFDLEVPWRHAIQSNYILLPLASGWMPPELRFPVLSRLVRDSGFDAEEVKKWLVQCDISHGLHCCITPDQRLAHIGMRLIDIEQNCLVRVTEHCAYTALTYVWGPVDQPVLKEGLIAEWETPGHFDRMHLPKTISDAIKVCRIIGLKYLWVDSLCIVQDDPLAVQEQINNMSLVYSQAYLTIVAASGDDCDSGLPSVQARQPIQKTFQADDLSMGTAFLSLKQELVKSKWNSRAWTLQEYTLSCRCLVFTPREIFFCCAEGIRREDVSGYLVEGIPRQDLFIMPVVRDSFLSNNLPSKIFAKVYWPLVEHYAAREASYASDILKAFSGITGALEKPIYLGEFVAGIPESFIGAGLAWSFHGQCSRRAGFPSWSWAGWTFEPQTRETFMTQTFTGEDDKGFHYFPQPEHLQNPMRIDRWTSPDSEKFMLSSSYESWKPWSDRSGWNSGVRQHAQTVILEMGGTWSSSEYTKQLAPKSIPGGEIHHVLFFRSCYAILDTSRYRGFRLNNRPAGKESAKPFRMLFILILIYPPKVMILPVERDGDVLRRVDNPQLIHEKEWFQERPRNCLVHLA
ncbi:hypothetical protein INS49_003290 [Diaporthe citri]|uniref:uncharacterized protein n=1 Tax=Diaporthe citri TaxID=83186 RepID=UPI001C81BFE1|nr:uncharacterized protein INS49_003290 [Diaporthe citri]KAG6355329.1 hypothetical protein INS49_003290 [Diaporthe citri]